MKLAILKKDLCFFGGGVLPKGTTIQVVNGVTFAYWLGCYRLSAPGGLVSLVREDELDDTVEFLDDETSDT